MSKRPDTITQLRSTVQTNVSAQLVKLGVAPKTEDKTKVKQAA